MVTGVKPWYGVWELYDILNMQEISKELISMAKIQGEDGRIDMCKGLSDWAAEKREACTIEGIVLNLTGNFRNLVKKLNLTDIRAGTKGFDGSER